MVRRRQTQPSLGIRGGLVPGRRSDTKIHRCSSPGREVVSSLHRSCACHPPMRSMPSPDYLQHLTCCKRCINSCSTVFLSSALLLLLYFFLLFWFPNIFNLCWLDPRIRGSWLCTIKPGAPKAGDVWARTGYDELDPNKMESLRETDKFLEQ